MIDEQTFRALIASGLTFADIGRLHGVSRERIRQLGDQYGVSIHPCGQCGCDIPMRKLLCAGCAKERKQQRVRHKERVKNPRSYNDRPIVELAKEFLEQKGLTVEVDPYAPRAGAELIVRGVKIKCQQMVTAKIGHQVRLSPETKELGLDYWLLSDGTEFGMVPMSAITRPTTYIGTYSPLRKYFSNKWWDQIVEELRD